MVVLLVVKWNSGLDRLRIAASVQLGSNKPSHSSRSNRLNGSRKGNCAVKPTLPAKKGLLQKVFARLEEVRKCFYRNVTKR